MRGILLTLLLCGVFFSARGDTIEQLRSQLEQQKYDHATTIGQALLRQRPDDLETLFLTALAFQHDRQFEQAARYYRRMLDIDPSLPEPLNNLAYIHQQQGEHDKAIELLTASINTHPAYATAWKNLGSLYRGLASDAYRRALSEGKDVRPAIDKLQLTALTRLHDLPPVLKTPVPSASVEPAQPGSSATATPARPETAATRPITVAQTALPANPEPAPVVSASSTAAPAPQLPSEKLLTETLGQWAQAWQNKDFDRYIAAYANDYRGRKRNHRAWVEYRRDRVLKPGDISIELSNIHIKSRNARRAVIDFHQAYRSPGYRDRVAKRIVLINHDGSWKISRESTLAVL